MNKYTSAILSLCIGLLFTDVSSASTFSKPESEITCNGCKIKILPNGYKVTEGGEVLEFNDKDKPAFDSGTGEVVTEYTGLATDKNAERSWAKAIFAQQAVSPAHLHKERTEDYYITSLNAKALVIVDGVEHPLSTGDHLRILPGQIHQVMNLSQEYELSLLVKCFPSWSFADHNLV